MKAGVWGMWYKYTSKVVGVDRYCKSDLCDIVMKELGKTAETFPRKLPP
jgi:transketolase